MNTDAQTAAMIHAAANAGSSSSAVEMFIADSTREAGKAQADANRANVAAGLTPQERAEWEYKTKVGVAEALAK